MKVFIIAALTVDGFIGRSSKHLADWTGGEDKKLFVQLTKEAGIVVMGSRTFATIGRALPGRRTIVYTKDASHVTVPDVEVTSEAPADLLARLETEGASSVAICGGTSIYELFVEANLVDELYLTFVPIAFGKGLNLFAKEHALKLKLLETSALADGSIFAHYAVNK